MDCFGVCVLYSICDVILGCLRDGPRLLQLHSHVIARSSRATLVKLECILGWKSMDNYDTCASVFVVLFNGFMSLTSYFDVMYRY